MLTVAKVNSSQAAGYADYLEGKSTASSLGDYYLKDGERVEAPGRWVSGATQVGADLMAVVAGEQLRDLMAVRFPGTDRPLRRVGGSGEAVAALDATFSAPKSVSAMWAVGDEPLREAIELAQEAAVGAALRYSLAYVPMIRERVSSTTVVHAKADELIATSWRHTTARAVADRLPDPQLHSHVLLHAAVRKDGQVVAIDSRAWLVHRREIAAAYRTELARELAELGFDIHRGTGRGGRYFEIRGVPQELMDRWSSRGHQIQEAIDANVDSKRARLEERISAGGPEADVATAQLARLNATGRLEPAEDRLLRVRTRSAKNPAVTDADLNTAWLEDARRSGLAPQPLSAVVGSEGRRVAALDRDAMLGALTEFDATFIARDARAVAMERSAGASVNETMAILRGMWLDGQVLMLEGGSQTTATHRSIEFDVIAAAERLTENETNAIDPRHVLTSAAVTDQTLQAGGGRLSDEQRQALELATGEHQLVMIEGQAGTGKSTVLQAVARSHQAAGQQIIVTSTAGLAAQRLANDLQDAGVTATAYSTAALTHSLNTGRLELDPDSTVIHDEAALASTREQDALLTAVEQSGARLIVVGDPQQSKPVGAGGLWSHLERATKDQGAHVELTQNLRARDPEDRRDQQQFRNGHHDDAVGGYAERGRVHLSPNLTQAEDEALEAAHLDRSAGRRTVVVAQTSNDHLDELNARAQALRHQAGELGRDAVPVPGRPYSLHEGDDVQIRRNAVDSDGTQLRNGTTASVTSIDPSTGTARLQLSDGAHVDADHVQLQAADVRLAYVQHPFPAQGITTDTAHLIVGEHASREGTYVAITRPRAQAHIYASHDQIDHQDGKTTLERLAGIMARTEPDLPSIATPLKGQTPANEPVTPPAPVPEWQQALGTRPADQDQLQQWETTVDAVRAYRNRHHIPDTDTSVLGPEPSAGAFSQRLERRQVAEQLNAADLAAGQQPGADMDRNELTPVIDQGLEP